MDNFSSENVRNKYLDIRKYEKDEESIVCNKNYESSSKKKENENIVEVTSTFLLNEQYFEKIQDINKWQLVVNGIYICRICEKKYGTSLGLRRHIVRSHSNQVLLYKCELCEKSFRTRTQCRNHKCLKEEPKINSADEDDVKLSEDKKLSKHSLFKIYNKTIIDSDTNSFCCPLCNLVVRRKTSLKHHLFQNHLFKHDVNDSDSETSDKLNQLDIVNSTKCKKPFKDFSFKKLSQRKRQNLNNNENEVLEINEEQEFYSCAKCSKTFSSKVHIKQHIQNEECLIDVVEDEITKTKEEYLKTLKILKRAKLTRKKLKRKLLALEKNLVDPDSESDLSNDGEIFSMNAIDDENNCFNLEIFEAHNNRQNDVNEDFEFNKIDIEDNVEIEIIQSDSEPQENCIVNDKSDKNDNIQDVSVKIEKTFAHLTDKNIDIDSVEILYDNFENQNDSTIDSEDIDCNEEKYDINKECLDENIIYEVPVSENVYLKTEKIIENENIMRLDYLNDRTSNQQHVNTNNENIFTADYVDEPFLEEWIENSETEKSPDQDKEDNGDKNLETHNENNLKGKFNEKFMSFLYKSLKKEEIQRKEVNRSRNKNHSKSETTINSDKQPDKKSNNQFHKCIKYQCPLCKKIVANKSSLQLHLRVHTNGEKQFKCSICERRCYDRASLNIHEKRHTNDRPHKCEFCEERFFTLFEKKRHQVTWHQKGTKRCEEKPGTLRHIMTYDQKREFSPKALLGSDGLYHCKMCEKICITAKTMRKHTALHFNGKPCPLCSKVFAYESTLQRHLRVPHEEKNFMCTVCGNRYASASSLKTHTKVHSEEAIKCPICPKFFGTMYNFDRHMIHKHKLKNWHDIYPDIVSEKLDDD